MYNKFTIVEFLGKEVIISLVQSQEPNYISGVIKTATDDYMVFEDSSGIVSKIKFIDISHIQPK